MNSGSSSSVVHTYSTSSPPPYPSNGQSNNINTGSQQQNLSTISYPGHSAPPAYSDLIKDQKHLLGANYQAKD